jgi:hypothetical protein
MIDFDDPQELLSAANEAQLLLLLLVCSATQNTRKPMIHSRVAAVDTFLDEADLDLPLYP